MSERAHFTSIGPSRGGRRPRVVGVQSSSRLTIRLTPGERSDLESVARENHTNLADVLREAVNEYVNDYRERKVFATWPEAKS
jgi:hypothetical protein